MPSNQELSPQHAALSTQYSTSPTGEQFPLPTPQDEAAEIARLESLVAAHRAQGHEIVVVLGVGFVGAVMAGIVADSVVKEAPSTQHSALSPQHSALSPPPANPENS